MMEYTGKYWEMESKELGETVNILEYKAENRKHLAAWCECSKCGKPIKRLMYVVQDMEDIEVMYLGADCVKKFT